MREELEVSVQKQEFERAASLKARVSELEENKHNLLNQTVPSTQEVRTDKVICTLYMNWTNDGLMLADGGPALGQHWFNVLCLLGKA